VGDDTGSRLYWELIDPGLADSADCSYYENDGSGIVYASFTCEPEKAEQNLEIVRKVMTDVQRESITAEELRLAKSKSGWRWARGSEGRRGRMCAIAWAWAYTGEYRSVVAELANYDAVSPADVRAYLDAYPLDRLTTVAFGPAEKLAGVGAK